MIWIWEVLRGYQFDDVDSYRFQMPTSSDGLLNDLFLMKYEKFA
jgi:hypothetical protein